jgi:hypothetical protein
LNALGYFNSRKLATILSFTFTKFGTERLVIVKVALPVEIRDSGTEGLEFTAASNWFNIVSITCVLFSSILYLLSLPGEPLGELPTYQQLMMQMGHRLQQINY